MSELRIATWNTEWREVGSRDAKGIRERLAAFAPDIVCLTECYSEFLNGWGGHIAEGGSDWGYPASAGRREVLLWSRSPWREIDSDGSPDLPSGRFVRAVTDSALGPLTVIGVVIPYHFAHVRHGRRDRKPWQEHCLYLDALGSILAAVDGPCVVLGDYNQRVPSTWVPREAQRKREAAFAGFSIVTANGLKLGEEKPIDHIACDSGLVATRLGTLSNIAENGSLLSDHFGVTAALARAAAAHPGAVPDAS